MGKDKNQKSICIDQVPIVKKLKSDQYQKSQSACFIFYKRPILKKIFAKNRFFKFEIKALYIF